MLHAAQRPDEFLAVCQNCAADAKTIEGALMNRLGLLGAGFVEARDFGGTHQTKTYGPLHDDCEAAVAAMLLAQIASEVGISAEVVLQLNGAMLQVVLAGQIFRPCWAPKPSSAGP